MVGILLGSTTPQFGRPCLPKPWRQVPLDSPTLLLILSFYSQRLISCFRFYAPNVIALSLCARDPVLFFDFFLVFHTQYACAPSRGIIRVDSVDSVSRKNQEQLQEPFRPTSTYHLVVMSSSWLLWTFFCNSLRECNAWLYAARLTVEIIYDIWYSTPLLVLGLAHSIGPIYPVCSTV